MTTLAEIPSAISHLYPAEREQLRPWLDETVGESPEILTLLDEGLRSLKARGVIPLEDVRQSLTVPRP